MIRLPEEHMAGVYAIRQDYARALSSAEAYPTAENVAAHTEQHQRRARAIRSLHRDDGATVTQLSAMFRCSKTAVRNAIAADTE